MQRWFTIAKVSALILFLAMSGAVVGYQMLVVWPPQRCERGGAWWDPRDRQCLTPIPIERFTQRAMRAAPDFKPVGESPQGPTEHPPVHGR